MRNTMKRLLPICLAALMLLGLIGCADAEQAELEKEEKLNNLKQEISVDVKNDLDGDLSKIEEQFQKQLDEAREKYDQDLAELQTKYEEQIDNLRSEYEGDIDELEEEIANLKADFTKEVDGLQAELDGVSGRLKKAGESLFGESLTEEAEEEEEAPEEEADEPEEEEQEAEPEAAEEEPDSAFAALDLPEYDEDAYADLLNPLEEEAEDPFADREPFYERRAEIDPAFFIAGLQYYEEIAGFGEFSSDYDGYVKKWKDPVFVAVEGDYTEEDMATLERITSQLNSLGLLPEITIQEAQDEKTTHFFDFQPLPDLVKKYEWARDDNWGMFMIRWYGEPREYQIFDSLIYIATDVTKQNERNHLIQEEFIQSFGLMNDSYRYEKSIFQQKWTTYQHPTELDWLLIEMHNRPEIEPGMEIQEAMQILADLYLDYVE